MDLVTGYLNAQKPMVETDASCVGLVAVLEHASYEDDVRHTADMADVKN